MADKLSDFATINREGEVFIKAEDLSDKDKTMLILSIRAVASRLLLNEGIEISDKLTLDEIAKYGKMNRKVASARISDLKNDGKIQVVNRGLYKVRSLVAIEEFVNYLQHKRKGEGSV